MGMGIRTGKPKGRPKGSPNKITRTLKEAILEAAEQAGGPEGTVGYLRMQATANPGPFMSLLGKVLPTQLTGENDGPIKTDGTLRVEFVETLANGDDPHSEAV
jgi:hypothetical protein